MSWMDMVENPAALSLDLPAAEYVLCDPERMMPKDMFAALLVPGGEIRAACPVLDENGVLGHIFTDDAGRKAVILSCWAEGKYHRCGIRASGRKRSDSEFSTDSGFVGIIDRAMTRKDIPQLSIHGAFRVGMDSFGTIAITGGKPRLSLSISTCSREWALAEMGRYSRGAWIARNIDQACFTRTVEAWKNDSQGMGFGKWVMENGFIDDTGERRQLPNIVELAVTGALHWQKPMLLPEWLAELLQSERSRPDFLKITQAAKGFATPAEGPAMKPY